jgi:SAM-dependent methyltransferase
MTSSTIQAQLRGRRGEYGFDAAPPAIGIAVGGVALLFVSLGLVEGNGPDAARHNLETEGVKDRCQLVTGDMRELPFPDASFNLVVSSIAIHNVSDRAGRSRAIHEIARVLKPGGRVVIADLAWTDAYAKQLQGLGLLDVRRRSLGWRFWWGPVFLATRLVTAFKPPLRPEG